MKHGNAMENPQLKNITDDYRCSQFKCPFLEDFPTSHLWLQEGSWSFYVFFSLIAWEDPLRLGRGALGPAIGAVELLQSCFCCTCQMGRMQRKTSWSDTKCWSFVCGMDHCVLALKVSASIHHFCTTFFSPIRLRVNSPLNWVPEVNRILGGRA